MLLAVYSSPRPLSAIILSLQAFTLEPFGNSAHGSVASLSSSCFAYGSSFCSFEVLPFLVVSLLVFPSLSPYARSFFSLHKSTHRWHQASFVLPFQLLGIQKVGQCQHPWIGHRMNPAHHTTSLTGKISHIPSGYQEYPILLINQQRQLLVQLSHGRFWNFLLPLDTEAWIQPYCA